MGEDRGSDGPDVPSLLRVTFLPMHQDLAYHYQEPAVLPSSFHSFLRSIILALFFIPMSYLGLIAAVFIHEFIGHGLMAWLCGEAFRGFTLQWDGMGWADINIPKPGPVGILIMAAGMAATTFFGLLTLAAAVWISNRLLFLRLGLFLLAFNCLLEGPPYAFWNAYHPTCPGDMGQLLLLVDNPQTWRGGFLLVGGLITAGALFFVPALILSSIEHWLTPGKNLRGWPRVLTLLLLTLLITSGEMTFDWNQLAPGLNCLPQLVAVPLQFLIAVVLYFLPWHVPPTTIPLRQGWLAVVWAWLMMLFAIFVMVFWLTKGLKWA